MIWPRFLIGLFSIFVMICFCEAEAVSGTRDQRSVVFTSIAPYAYFIDQIGGGTVDVVTLVGPGKDPHNFEPAPSQMTGLSSARAYFKVGMPFESRLLNKVSSLFPDLKVIDLNSGIDLRPMESSTGASAHGHAGSEARHDHKHKKKSSKDVASKEHSHGHDHGTLDPHVWLNPANAKIIALNVTEALSELFPSQADLFKRNCQAFEEKLERLDVQMADSLRSLKGRNFYVYHPAFGYLADRYGFRQKAVEMEGKEPTARQLAALIDSARKDGVRVIFVAPQFSKKGAETIARGINGVVVEIDPLESNYLANMANIAEKIKSGVKQD